MATSILDQFPSEQREEIIKAALREHCARLGSAKKGKKEKEEALPQPALERTTLGDISELAELKERRAATRYNRIRATGGKKPVTYWVLTPRTRPGYINPYELPT